MTDKRHSQRKKTLLGAWAEFGSHDSTMTCIVRNLSEGGAMIRLDNAVALPGEITLAIPQQGLRRKARVAWRRIDAAGLAFLAA